MTRLLLDTHVWLWMLERPERLSVATRERLEDGATELWLSAVSVVEIAIKHRLGKLDLPAPVERYVPERMRRTAVDALPLEVPHALALAALPLHHRDPFDRMLIAQAVSEQVPLVTADDAFGAYDVEVLPAA